MDNYDALQLARRQVDHFDEVLAQHRDALACGDCEDGIQLGMKALEWIGTAEGILISAENDCLVPYGMEAHVALHRGYEQWLATAERLLEIAGDWERKGFQVAHLADLQGGAVRARDWLDTQAAIVAATLTESELAERARCFNLSLGNVSPNR